MTVIIALKCIDETNPNEKALIFAADRQKSSTYLKTPATKIRFIFNPDKDSSNLWGLLFAGSGDLLILDEVWYKIDKYFNENSEMLEKDPTDILRKHRETIGKISYDTYKEYILRYKTINEINDCDFDFMIGANNSITPTILYVNCMGNTQIEDEFKIIGSGVVTGGELLLNELYKKKFNIQ